MLPAPIVEGLNAEQLSAVGKVRGPLCILAGAGSGKTTTITRRIAAQVASGAFRPSEILAVTFTDKAAGEMRTRLGRLGVAGVRARTFHSAAAAQLRALKQEPVGDILPSKAVALAQIARSLPKPYRFRPAADLATEIEWAKNRRLTVDAYAHRLGSHRPPIPADLMVTVWRRYEEGKRKRGLVDFEDLLELAIQMYDADAFALERFQERYGAFTVDEYQDVNLLQQTLLERWVGERDDICVVGDDLQAIYSFTGATSEYLTGFAGRWPRAAVVRLETNYRSTPQVLEVANRVAERAGGIRKVLRPVAGDGPAVEMWAASDSATEVADVVARVEDLHQRGVASRDIAVLYRVNYRSEDFEEAFVAAGIPFQVRDGGFLQRPAARRLLATLRGAHDVDVTGRVRAAATRAGWSEEAPEGLGERELTRQRDLARLVDLAAELDTGDTTVGRFVEEVTRRFAGDGDADGVQLLTLHRAKGLEFEAVFLPRVQEGELPFKRATDDAAVAEERRLFYVGITRAKRHLFVSWVDGARNAPSRFLDDLRPAAERPRPDGSEDSERVRALRSWRKQRARADGVPAYVVLHDATLEAIARRRPASAAQLSSVSGIGPAKVERYGAEIIATLAAVEG